MRQARQHELEAEGIRVALDLDLGQMAHFEVIRGQRRINPFSRVSWADGPEDPARFPADMPPHLRAMSGDFFCAPFCADDVDGGPFHGWPGNSAWDLVDEIRDEGGVTARFRLRQKVAGAVLDKIWRLRDRHPFLYQRHSFAGGTGPINLAHHAMVDLASGGHLRFSPLLRVETFAGGPDNPTSLLKYPAQGPVHAFPGRDGPVDLTRYPIGQHHVEVAMAVDLPGQGFGWTTALRPAHRDVAILIKSVSALPQTMLWFSNGATLSPPWCGQHVGVLGIEQACTYGTAGRKASVEPNALSRQGIPTAVDLAAAAVVSVSTALGAAPTLAGSGLDVAIGQDHIALADGTIEPFDPAWVNEGPMLVSS
jgi:hypothetical protein